MSSCRRLRAVRRGSPFWDDPIGRQPAVECFDRRAGPRSPRPGGRRGIRRRGRDRGRLLPRRRRRDVARHRAPLRHPSVADRRRQSARSRRRSCRRGCSSSCTSPARLSRVSRASGRSTTPSTLRRCSWTASSPDDEPTIATPAPTPATVAEVRTPSRGDRPLSAFPDVARWSAHQAPARWAF